MDNRVYCDHVYIAGKKKGQTCGVFCRGGGPKCYQHKPRKTNNYLCEHNRRKDRCIECGTGQCEHGRNVNRCIECGAGYCEHGRSKYKCIDCDTGYCKHGRINTKCVDCGTGRCEHGRAKYSCGECGTNKCEHGKSKYRCAECGGESICLHLKRKIDCAVCNPIGHLKKITTDRVRRALGKNKLKKTLEYVGCTTEQLKEHIEKQFKEGMTWENKGDWHIDHIIPITYDNPTLDEVIKRLHYTNLQPLWATENIAKGNRFVG